MRLTLPAKLSSTYGIQPGDSVYVNEMPSGLDICLPTRLSKLYIEPTNQCNLNCRTCIRHSWNEQPGMMTDMVFDRVMDGLSAFSPLPMVFFGGFGEPLFHPKILDMVLRVKSKGAAVQLITNGTLLTRDLSRELIKAEIDGIWVSIDGASPDSYADVRQGAVLKQVLENVAAFRDALHHQIVLADCGPLPSQKTFLGIAFVAMKRNISDLPAVLNLARRFGAKRFIMTNVLPHTREMRDEVLYDLTLREDVSTEPGLILSMPRIDVTERTLDSLYQALQFGKIISWAGINLTRANARCPFIENGLGAIAWDGGFSPCLELLHSHSSYVLDRERFSRRWIVGNIADESLSNLWHAKEHTAFRQRVKNFAFPPCVYCGGCEVSNSNEEDCQGNGFPTCGDCLWAQGLIQCP